VIASFYYHIVDLATMMDEKPFSTREIVLPEKWSNDLMSEKG